jgi:hypothetical protein
MKPPTPHYNFDKEANRTFGFGYRHRGELCFFDLNARDADDALLHLKNIKKGLMIFGEIIDFETMVSDYAKRLRSKNRKRKSP